MFSLSPPHPVTVLANRPFLMTSSHVKLPGWGVQSLILGRRVLQARATQVRPKEGLPTWPDSSHEDCSVSAQPGGRARSVVVPVLTQASGGRSAPPGSWVSPTAWGRCSRCPLTPRCLVPFAAEKKLEPNNINSYVDQNRQMFLIQVGWLPHGPRALSLWGPHDAAPTLSTPWI